MPDFIVCDWRAWASGLGIGDNKLIDSDRLSVPECVPKTLHRRLSPLAKAVFNAAQPCIENNRSMPVVFSSAHGEICKSLEMLKTIQAGQELSPTAFSLSVHNAIAGLFSIAFNNNQEITVIAPGQEGIAPAFIEALGLLQEGAEEVLVIFYDDPIADFYPIAPYKLSSEFACVLGLRLALKGGGLTLNLSHSTESRDDGEHPVQLLALIRFLLADEKLLSLGNQGHSWTWRKH
jgi:Beta-ketoacyl synthase, N-terminal domain